MYNRQLFSIIMLATISLRLSYIRNLEVNSAIFSRFLNIGTRSSSKIKDSLMKKTQYLKSGLKHSNILNSAVGGEDISPSENYFRRGQKVKVRVTQFGPLGASVSVISNVDEKHNIAKGLALQREIALYRSKRGEDVVLGEVIGWP